MLVPGSAGDLSQSGKSGRPKIQNFLIVQMWLIIVDIDASQLLTGRDSWWKPN